MTTIQTGELDENGLYIERPSSISTFTHGRIDPLTPNPDDIRIEDIARALSRTCRYGGHVGGFLSVARHCLWVADVLAGTPLELAGLLHDASEAYIGDLVRPLKHDPSMSAFRAADERLDRMIAEKFGFPFPMAPEVAAADRTVLLDVEMVEPHGKRWTNTTSPDDDEREFLARYRRLTGLGTTVPYTEAQIVGLMGYAQSGKDTAARVLVDEFGFQRVAFADALREMALAIDPLVTVEHVFIDTPPYTMRYSDLVRELGYEGAKRNSEVRRFLQALGTEGVRNVLGQDTWVETAMARLLPGHRYVFTDVRFPNEAQAVKGAGGELWRIVRPSTGPVNEHPSETALDSWQEDRSILNFGTVDALSEHVARARREMLRRRIG